MNDRFDRLARRKQALIAQCARDREELESLCNRIRLPLNFGAVVVGIGKLFRDHPLLAAGASSLVVSGYGIKLTRSVGGLLRLGTVLRPLWSWWRRRGA
ncbi:MAG TPA: hypothetical protein VFU31_03785 [Candidatus Binatia bacterium]|nr:hypothetical protein [Candidatus Binatia bacterium]